MTHEEALQKVAKLLRLAKSDNVNEAAVAASMAQAIMERFKLQASDVDVNAPNGARASTNGARPQDSEPIQNFGHVPLDTQNSTWRIRLASTLAHANQCMLYLSGKHLCLVGRASDVDTVRYLYSWLAPEIDRLTVLHGKGNGKTWCNNFRLGVCDAIAEKIHAQTETTRAEVRAEAFATGGESAIVRVNQSIERVKAQTAEVSRWAANNMKLGRGTARTHRSDFGAREAGRKVGQSIHLNSARGSLGSGT